MQTTTHSPDNKLTAVLSKKAEEARSLLTPDDRLFRHEYKYLVTAAQIPVLQARIAGLMRPDPHAGPDGTYRIRSVYFDDLQDRCYWDNENGVDHKKKYRIRIYNASDARILLERKEGVRGKKFKSSDLLTRDQAEALLSGKRWPGSVFGGPDSVFGGPGSGSSGSGSGKSYKVLPGLCADQMINGMRPVIIVEYDRVPFVYRWGNVRVTFDRNISASGETGRFFDREIPRRPIMPAGMHLMEVKFDGFLPDVIYRALQLERLRQTTFSKYYLCRKYSNRP